MARERDDLWAKFEEFALKEQCIPGFAEQARCLRARVAELKEASKKKTAKMWAKRKTMDMEVVAELARTKRAEYTARSAQSEGELHERKGELDVRSVATTSLVCVIPCLAMNVIG